jgi:hypothetical protein
MKFQRRIQRQLLGKMGLQIIQILQNNLVLKCLNLLV